MATILVTGGAGYVGSHCCLALKRAGHSVVVYDNLYNGHERFVKWGPFERGDIRDRARLAQVFATHRPDAVLHCAALIEVGESVKFPDQFYDNNVTGALVLLDVMREAGVKPFVFSSTCATYGEPQRLPMDETHPQAPVSPYGWTKLMIERASRDIAAAHGLKFAHLRYFNAAGAAPAEGIGEHHDPETHALPLALFTLLGRREGFKIFGSDWDTRDGSCLRDYVHTMDLADAHVRAIERLLGRREGFKIFGSDWDTRDGSCLRDYVHTMDLADAHVRAIERLLGGGENIAANLGTGDGVTVLELLAAIERVTGRRVPATPAPRRDGDAPALVADTSFVKRELGWSAQRDIDAVIADAWEWHSAVEPNVFA